MVNGEVVSLYFQGKLRIGYVKEWRVDQNGVILHDIELLNNKGNIKNVPTSELKNVVDEQGNILTKEMLDRENSVEERKE